MVQKVRYDIFSLLLSYNSRAGARIYLFFMQTALEHLQLNNATIIHAVIRLSTAPTGSVFVYQLCGPISVSAADIGAVSIR